MALLKRPSPPPPIPQWEYLQTKIGLVLADKPESIDYHAFRKLGWQGWELVTVVHYPEKRCSIAHFKRQIIFDENGLQLEVEDPHPDEDDYNPFSQND